ncbi:DUF2807 domain-containing protein [uncultured Sphingomonas sp.]|uniref:GIN domain-containing protein n=1 Tax=uncultured Sphingomonas sp. TaxID=158754 RepID=UPI0025E1476B|nr:DUF2807 domain-containing protein [uncultured Sphingomonas sp.]
MKKISAIALLSLATAGASAQDNAQTSRSFALRGFDRIDLGGCDIVTVALGTGYAVTAQGRAANIDNLRMDMQGTTLRIRRRNDSCNGHDRRVAIAITLPTLKAVDVGGAAEMNLPLLYSQAFAVAASGASVVRLPGLRGGSASFGLSGASKVTVRNLRVDRASLKTSGASALRVEGAVGQLTIGSSGTSDVDARALSVSAVTVGASGMSAVTVAGHPACTVSKSGLARVTCG